jgi:FkbM family methyltransferase
LRLKSFTRINATFRQAFKPHLISRLKVIALQSKLLARTFSLRYFSLNSLDQQIEKYLDFDLGYYVELGANDGVNQSNTLYFEHFRGWKRVLIEPYLHNFNQLTRNRSAKNHFVHAACVGPDFKFETVRLAYSNLMTSTLDIKSDVADPWLHAHNGSRFWGGQPFVFEAPARTLNQVLANTRSPNRIDLLSLDVEGVELEILKGVDHSKFRFRFICVESRDPQKLQEYLQNFDYQFVKSLSDHDFLFQDVQSI